MPHETVLLRELAHTRSGDKGNHANVAVIAYAPEGFAWLKQHLTDEAVARYFAPLGASKVERFEAPNLHAFNFMLYNVLAGGASRSLRIDTQGKALGQAVLLLPVPRPEHLDTMKRGKLPGNS